MILFRKNCPKIPKYHKRLRVFFFFFFHFLGGKKNSRSCDISPPKRRKKKKEKRTATDLPTLPCDPLRLVLGYLFVGGTRWRCRDTVQVENSEWRRRRSVTTTSRRRRRPRPRLLCSLSLSLSLSCLLACA